MCIFMYIYYVFIRFVVSFISYKYIILIYGLFMEYICCVLMFFLLFYFKVFYNILLLLLDVFILFVLFKWDIN